MPGNKVIKKYNSGRKNIFIITSILTFTGLLVDYLQNNGRYAPYQTIVEYVNMAIILVAVISYFVNNKLDYKVLFAFITYSTIINILLGHIIFFPYSLDTIISIFLRNSIFIIALTGLSGFVIGRRHAIFQTVLHLTMYFHYAFILQDPFILNNIALFVLTISGFGYLIYYSVFSVQRFINNLKQFHKLDALQKDTIIKKNQEILDSIIYARRIQSAILPPNKIVKSYLPDSFIYYKPKDVIAGDFYWMENKDSAILFAAADCTGHGVPGALISVVCNNSLNRAVNEFDLSDPGEILCETKRLVVNEFEKSDEDVQDGMDIALCSLDGRTLKYAGAYNPLWIIRNGADHIETWAPNKQPIAKFDVLNPYTTHTIELFLGDAIYIFTDGFADQFGGEKGKKLKPINFKKFLLSIQNYPMSEQYKKLDYFFNEWKGDLEQVDDVCVIGVKIE
jgi:serine phosphatase RsbU (regulator of sigma subunit)